MLEAKRRSAIFLLLALALLAAATGYLVLEKVKRVECGIGRDDYPYYVAKGNIPSRSTDQ